MAHKIDFSLLADPFPGDDIEWRVQRSGMRGAKPWAMVLAYVTSRAIMDRLDEVCGPENWTDTYLEGPQGGVMCGIGIRVGDDEWVWKYDGADNTQVEAVKGGYSAALKRAGVKWGIGRYLYKLEAGWANFSPNGANKVSIKKSKDDRQGEWFKWDPPALPSWALPSGSTSKPAATKPAAKPKPAGPEMATAEQAEEVRMLLRLDLLSAKDTTKADALLRKGSTAKQCAAMKKKLLNLEEDANQD